MHTLYANEQKGSQTIAQAEKELFQSIEKSYDLYLWLLRSLVDLQRFAQEKIDIASQKRLPTQEDLNPNRKFVGNDIIGLLAESEAFFKACDNRKISWYLEKDMLKDLFEKVKASRDYKEYMENPEKSFEEDKAFVIKLFKYTIANFEPFHQWAEEHSIYLIDDIDLACSMIIKNLKSIKQGEPFELLELYYGDQEEEEEFARILLKKTLEENETLVSIINGKTKNWELDRIAVLDMILMKMGIIEAKYFKTIPTKVSLNEYIELAKFYSTDKSSTFINGVLDRIFVELKADGTITKIGRGLMD
jgi:N utilization substance protein B